MPNNSTLPVNLKRELILFRLNEAGIHTIGDLDRYRGGRTRLEALTFLVGADAATWILREIAKRQCAATGQDYWERQYDDTGARGGALR